MLSYCFVGFIWLGIGEADDLGLTEVQPRPTKAKGKKVKSRKQTQIYVFNVSCKKSALYRDYFSPNSDAEKRVLGLVRARSLGRLSTRRSRLISF